MLHVCIWIRGDSQYTAKYLVLKLLIEVIKQGDTDFIYRTASTADNPKGAVPTLDPQIRMAPLYLIFEDLFKLPMPL